MAFKIKNPFKPQPTLSNQRTLGRDGRVISPVRQTNGVESRTGISQDYKDAIAAGSTVDPGFVGRLEDPRTAEEYYGSFDINPNLELKDPSLMDKGVKFLYDNPMIGKIGSYIAPNIYRNLTEKVMGYTGGQGGNFNQEDVELKEKHYQEMKDYYTEQLNAGDITQEAYDKEMLNIRPAGYTGGDEVGWRDEKINLARKYLGGDGGGLVPQTRYNPLSDDYGWLDTFSMKKGFDQNLDRIDKTSSFEGTTNEPNNEDVLDVGLYRNPYRTYRENFPSVVENIMENTKIYYDERGDVIPDKGYNPDKSTEENFKDLFKGKTFYGAGDENEQVGRGYFGIDLGGARIGLGADGKLPYASVWDPWDFQAHGKGGWSRKWADELGQNLSNEYYSKEMDAAKRDYMQAQLLNRASRDLRGKGGFIVYDSFYFTPDKYRDYIKDKDVDFMKEFYDIHHAGDESTWQEPVVISASKKKK